MYHFSQTVGKVGRVKVVFEDADVKVDVGGQTWTYNPYCLKPAPGERLSESQSRYSDQNIAVDKLFTCLHHWCKVSVVDSHKHLMGYFF